VSGDQRIRVTRIAHHPEPHVDLLGFLLDVGEDIGAAVLERRIAQPFLRRQRLRMSRSRYSESGHDRRAPDQIRELSTRKADHAVVDCQPDAHGSVGVADEIRVST
jgi:hypothetical protein